MFSYKARVANRRSCPKTYSEAMAGTRNAVDEHFRDFAGVV